MKIQFVQQYMGFDHIKRGEMIRNHITVFSGEFLVSGDSNTAILLIDGSNIYIEKSLKYAFQKKSYSI